MVSCSHGRLCLSYHYLYNILVCYSLVAQFRLNYKLLYKWKVRNEPTLAIARMLAKMLHYLCVKMF